ncbi:histidine phosphatase family protein [Lacticaseibacillus sharpeae]|uniref:histidine phosphatase family protein n=1 Tax=Lacticaseibacillus sharpeae TaxID=1626 RepID=UPI0006D2C240|nr:histidine phosphatase family protein [Lacticaseibacillus sharpeae]
MQRIFIIRHGKTEWNLAKRLQGAGADSPLRTDYAQQYADLARYLNQYSYAAAYSSPLLRARQTGEIILAKLNQNTVPAANCAGSHRNQFRSMGGPHP